MERAARERVMIDMSKKNWKDLFIGLSVIVMSTFLFFNGQYTIEIALLIAILTLWWLEFF